MKRLMTLGYGTTTLNIGLALMLLTFMSLISAPVAQAAACALLVSNEATLRTALNECNTAEGGIITLTEDISATTGEFNYLGTGNGNLTLNGGGHILSAISGATWRVFNFGGNGQLTLDNITVTGGHIRGKGGAVFASEGAVSVIHSTITNNVAGGVEVFEGGGGIYARGPVTVSDSTFSENKAGDPENTAIGPFGSGGAIYGGGIVNVSNTILKDNSANGGNGGAIFGEKGSNLTVTDSMLIKNSSLYRGGGISWSGTITIKSSTINGNNTKENGGGIHGSGDLLLVKDSSITGNTAAFDGGGLYGYALSELSVNNSTISDNKAEQNGGGIFIAGRLFVRSSTISGNVGKGTGGGIYMFFEFFNKDASGSVTNSTITGNSARDGGGFATSGDAPEIESRAKVTLNFSTLAANRSVARSANLSSNAEVILKGSVISNPLGSRKNCSKFVNASSSYSIEGSSIYSCGLGKGAGNQQVTVAAIGLGSLEDNNGPTLTMLPSSSSVLFTGAAPDALGTGITEDQRGVSRTGLYTLGAVQLVPGEINPYGFEGFFKPINNANWNNVNLGATVPVKWRLKDASTDQLITNPATVATKTYTGIECATGEASPGTSSNPALGSSVKWNKGARQFVFNWKTPKTGGKCVRLDINFKDASTHSAKFLIKFRN